MVNNDDNTIVPGPKMRIEWAVLSDGTMPGREFYNDLPKKTKALFNASWRKMATTGSIGQKRKFKRVDEEFSAFKGDTPENRMVRFPCFRRGNRWILTHGFFKPPQKRWPASAIPTAQRIRDEHLANEALLSKKKDNKNG